MIERKTSQMSDKNIRRDNVFITTYESLLNQAIAKPITVLVMTLVTFTAVIMLYSKFNSGVIFFPNDKAATARVEVMARGNLSPLLKLEITLQKYRILLMLTLMLEIM